MADCARCGHPLDVGRFCLNCGHPVGEPVAEALRTDTAERAAVPADRAVEVTAERAAVNRSHRAAGRSRGLWPLVLGAATALVLVAVLGAVLLFSGDDSPGNPLVSDRTPSASPTPSEEPSDDPAPSVEPSEEPSEEPQPSSDPTEVARTATVAVPATAPPNEDTEGNLVRYEGRNMLDGVPETCWRMPGDGTGETLVITLAEPTEVTRVGLVNGYAKSAGDLDWYDGNRRVLAVTWTIGGTTVEQELTETRELQQVDVPGSVVTDTIEVTLVEVTTPGTGPARRDYTALSELSVVGAPAR